MTETQLNQAYVDLGVENVWPLRQGAAPTESLGLYTTTGAAYANVTWGSPTGWENARTGNVPTTSGASGSYITLGTFGGVSARMVAGGGLTFSTMMATTNTAFNFGHSGNEGSQLQFGIAAGVPRIALYTSPGVGYERYAYRAMTDVLNGYAFHLAVSIDHRASMFQVYVNGELWVGNGDEGVSPANGLAMTAITNFMLGANSFNGLTNFSNFAAQFGEVTATARPMNEREIMRLCNLARCAYNGARFCPMRSGRSDAETRAATFRSMLSDGTARVAMVGDSTLSGLDTAMHRAAGSVAGRVANFSRRPGGENSGDNDAFAPPACRYPIPSGGGTYVHAYHTMNAREEFKYAANNSLGGSDVWLPNARTLDVTQGHTIEVWFSKAAAGAGDVSVRVDAAPKQLAFFADAQPWIRAVVPTTVLATAAELTGTAGQYVKKIVTVPAVSEGYFRITLTNAGSVAVPLRLIDFVSTANATGPRFYNFGQGGSLLSSYMSGRDSMYGFMAALGITHVIENHGTNDGWTVTPSAFAATFGTFASASAAGIPSLKSLIYSQPPSVTAKVDTGEARHSATLNARLDGYGDAVREWLAANPSSPGYVANESRKLIENYGWTQHADSLLGRSFAGDWAPATAYSATQVVAHRIESDAQNGRRYSMAVGNPASGAEPRDAASWLPLPSFHSDGTHLTPESAEWKAGAMIAAAVGISNSGSGSTPVSTGGGTLIGGSPVSLSSGRAFRG